MNRGMMAQSVDADSDRGNDQLVPCRALRDSPDDRQLRIPRGGRQPDSKQPGQQQPGDEAADVRAVGHSAAGGVGKHAGTADQLEDHAPMATRAGTWGTFENA